MGFFSRRIKRTGPGRFRVDLPAQERDLLRSFVPQLRELLTTDDPSLRRLFPSAYANDPEKDAGYKALVHDELLEGRFAALDLLESSIDGTSLSADELNAWMRGINDLRLVLGTRLDAGEELRDIEPDDPDAPAWAIYEYLGMLLTFIVDALSDDL